jgi:hypothetical protein
MKASRFLRDALRLCAATAILAGCGGQAGNSVVPIGDARNALSHHKSFFYTGAAQDFTVRRHVKQIKVIALGANGAGTYDGHGGRVSAQLTVNPGERLAIYVGGKTRRARAADTTVAEMTAEANATAVALRTAAATELAKPASTLIPKIASGFTAPTKRSFRRGLRRRNSRQRLCRKEPRLRRRGSRPEKRRPYRL